MSGRRVPLSSNPNAANSPYKAVAAAASKQKRSHANIQREDSYGQPPPTKKLMLESRNAPRTPPRQQSQQTVESRVFARKSTAPPTAFERKCASVRERIVPQTSASIDQKQADAEKEKVRQWRREYRQRFPKFVFYFENIPEDIRIKLVKQCHALGSREEKFFSNTVTHVVTGRAIPPELNGTSTSTTSESQSQIQTINPSLLDRSPESTSTQSDSLAKKFTLEAPLNRRFAAHGQDGDLKKVPGRSADVLHKARDLGMKIWAVEKLQRMMSAMFDADASNALHGHNTRSNSTATTATSRPRDADLSQLLRNERINGPMDRDHTVASKELILFKGPYIYIHDIDEKQRPIMVREYAKVAKKEHGDWPQFRSVANGKCPFVEEVDKREAEKEREMLRLQKQQEKEKSMVPRTRAAAAFEAAARMQPPKSAASKIALAEMDDGSKNIHSNKSYSTKSVEPSSRQNAFVSRAVAGRQFGGEPVASGLQPSNVTSAIRSNVTSSTAAQPGAKTGTSKEVHGLQRKVLEKNSGGPGSYGIPSSHRMTDITVATREDTAARPTKRKLGQIEEDVDTPEPEETAARKLANTRKAKAMQQRKSEKRDPKPGYCENCQDKFEDFDEHIISRKHRKFAEKIENWRDLDNLLAQLARPLREVY